MDSLPDSSVRQAPRLVIVHAAALTSVAFAAHYVWENVQCPLFFVHPDNSHMAATMVWATMGDVVLTWIAQLVVAAASRRWLWSLGRWGPVQWALLLASGGCMSVILEHVSLSAGRWSYASITPLIPGTGISMVPVAQLIVLFPLTFRLAARLAQALTLRGH